MFNVNDVVDVTGRQLSHYGVILQLRAGHKALVRFKTACGPKIRSRCNACDFPGMLSQNAVTGEIVCMRSGCGYGHGFDEREEEILLSQLINITAKRRDEKKSTFRKRVAALLEEGVNEKFLTPETLSQILKTI